MTISIDMTVFARSGLSRGAAAYWITRMRGYDSFVRSGTVAVIARSTVTKQAMLSFEYPSIASKKVMGFAGLDLSA
jgi:hypothetical protein